jgi:SHS2 domain-containing protein
VELNEADPEALLFEWLNQLLYIFDVERLLFKRFDVYEFDGRHLKATCYGEKYNPKRHQIKLGVKSATYHMMKVDAKKGEVQVIFDV